MNNVAISNNLTSNNQHDASISITKQDLVEIVEKSSNIWERLDGRFITEDSETYQELIQTRLDKWCQIIAKGNEQKFSKRLAFDKLDINIVRSALGQVSLPDHAELPNWTDTLRQAMVVAGSIGGEIFDETSVQKYSYIDIQDPLPFQEIYIPFIEVAKQKLMARLGFSNTLLSSDAQAQLERNLIHRLSDLLAECLNIEFTLFRSSRSSGLNHLIQKLQGNYSSYKYKNFVKQILDNNLLFFFKEYSVAARLAATVTDLWVETVEEFILRLASDWDKINQVFSPERELEKVINIEGGLSDPHNRGRSVMIVQFASGLKLVYKPKDLGLEKAYFEFLSWINQQNVTLPLKLLTILNCSTHGWMEFVESLPCENQQAVNRYYQRAGMVLCIAYVLRGTDFHYENIIASGEQPVLIDLETLFNPEIINQDIDDAMSKLRYQLGNSVSATALLPGACIPVGQTSNLAIDIGGLKDASGDNIPLLKFVWNYINTDGMIMEVQEDTNNESQKQKNQPFGDGIDTSLKTHNQELIDGFQQMYGFFRQYQEYLLADNSPIKLFKNQKLRIVLRNTQLYFNILSNSLRYQYLRDGVERSIQLDVISKGFISLADELHPLWGIISPEKQALEQLDIPYIAGNSNSKAIIINSETTIDDFFEVYSYDAVIDRLRQLKDEDLAHQIKIINASLYSNLSTEDLNSSLLENPNLNVSANTIVPLAEDTILQQAIAIGREIQQQAILGHDQDVAWAGMIYQTNIQRFQLLPLDFSLYNGNCGIALFLAALANVTNQSEFKELALGSIYLLRQALAEKDPSFQEILTKNMGLSGTKGLASLVYALVQISELLGETKLIDDAKQIASWLTLDTTADKQIPGILDGTASIILSLLALYAVTKEAETLVQATSWGQHLLDLRRNADIGEQVWTNSNEEPEVLIGFSQGIAGIAYALLRLYEVTQNSVFLLAAKEAISYEQNYLTDKDDLADSSTLSLSSINSWYDSLAGIILGRLGSLRILDSNEIYQEIDTNLPKILKSNLERLDSLCCGSFGNLEVLLLASEQLDRPELLETARQKIALALHRRQQNGSFQLLPSLSPDVYNPGFAQGTAGIGYELLRFLYPQRLPSVLLWQI
ncbi:type 2 lanthipeptide synthetase LanM family protein [Nostoc sp. UHCC 0870]|uniref:type 2 lanthipeptide synthetase LanM family protein n=1 Tax=Nostoc sp. UHCC 0870 TaxID=2914041 RepID=UPI001EDCF6C2|nr:type 2 lanthipeptide synthetase LanM family protein [Nostoc sp. UHCC 0870]UKO95901.1 type 2 lantipeptide synthetase LanM family protein [Nostoc sp. UHCC 0870]